MATLDQSFTTTPDQSLILRYSAAAQVKLAQQFTPSVTQPCTQVILGLRRQLTVTGNISVEIWSDTGSNLPNAIVGTGSGNVDASTVSALSDPTTEEITFTGINASLTASTKYWIVLIGTYAESSTNYIAWGEKSTGGYAGGITAAFDGTSWAAIEAGARDFYFKEYYTIPAAGGASYRSLLGVGI